MHNLILHPEDANSKVFQAIYRAFIAVENKAMTIKDLAHMTIECGLACQNVSAASQAITTYIRNHLQRCDAQQDHPLLLRHMLSGTAADDDLRHGLHSLSGGAHAPPKQASRPRHTNFRRGTIVWYLSKATGVACPFARAGIRLAEYRTDSDHVPRCGQKRKRLRSRGQDDHASDSGFADGDSDSDAPPAKVKLTLKLRRPSPDLSDADDDDPIRPEQDQPWSLPPYPRRSISIPGYTPSRDHGPFFASPHPHPPRSPSPDLISDDDSIDSPNIKEEDEPQPSAAAHEVRDLRGMLEAWEDVDAALPTPKDTVKWEWQWDLEQQWDSLGWNTDADNADSPVRIAKIDEPEMPFSPSAELGAAFRHFGFDDVDTAAWRVPPCSSATAPSAIPEPSRRLTWKDAELLGPDSVHPREFEDGTWTAREASAQSVCDPPPVVVHTCKPCIPAITATQAEGKCISVYQATLGAHTLLRRIDTDFVNLSNLLTALSLSPPQPSCPPHPAAVTIAHSSPTIAGTWVPLGAARHLCFSLDGATDENVRVFLSDELVMRFPSALRDFHKASAAGRMLEQFGLAFKGSSPVGIDSRLSVGTQGSASPSPQSPSMSSSYFVSSPAPPLPSSTSPSPPAEPPSSSSPPSPAVTVPSPSPTPDPETNAWIPDPDPILHPSFDFALAALRVISAESNAKDPRSGEGITAGTGVDSPLSPTEAEMFRTLCVCPDWEGEEIAETAELEVDVDMHTDVVESGDLAVDAPSVVPDAVAPAEMTPPDEPLAPLVDDEAKIKVDTVDVDAGAAVKKDSQPTEDVAAESELRKCLRRSKRVADARSRVRTRPRIRGGPRSFS
ncbi:hypothetical protein BJ138DRAFT_1109173 [Hygrophoropsis aurantiaca]|uniref:Uncharacterized protein n=1 Tax=Hygrophoropsis aurantiaca TaxID=72124 RepID=A0ACB8ASW1_9AGAM|nr:hypothetical protein BJ138DRAFT_1109173 [Hygrophoropsis aurantiaca]